MSPITEKTTRLFTAKIAVALAALLLWPAAAQADRGVNFSVRTPVLAVTNVSHRGFSHQRRFNNFGTRRNRGFRNRGFRNRGFRNHQFFSQRSPGFIGNRGFNGSRFNGSRGCQNVSKEGYWDGRPALIGGLQCFDSYGQAFISPNSRHLIRYY